MFLSGDVEFKVLQLQKPSCNFFPVYVDISMYELHDWFVWTRQHGASMIILGIGYCLFVFSFCGRKSRTPYCSLFKVHDQPSCQISAACHLTLTKFDLTIAVFLSPRASAFVSKVKTDNFTHCWSIYIYL